MPSPLILTDAGSLTPPDRPFWTTPQMWDPKVQEPTWSSGQVSKTFLALSRWTVTGSRGVVTWAHGVDGLPDLDPPRASGSSERYLFRLYDIELLAHHMAVQRPESMTPGKLRKVLLMVLTCAQLHGYL